MAEPRVETPPSGIPWGLVHTARITLFHASALLVLVVGWSPVALATCGASFTIRLFAVAGGYHRYFSHRSFRTSRAFQFVLAVLGTTSGQKGPLSWATSHRLHHARSDRPGDPHSPVVDGLWYAHLGWLLEPDALPTDPRLEAEYRDQPEIVWLNRLHPLGPLALMALLWVAGERAADLGTSGPQLVVWGFVVSTLLVLHGTCLVNSVGHRFGSQRYPGRDGSRNVWWIWPLTLGENWHNNHHADPRAARAGHAWWEVDLIYAGIRLLEAAGLVWDVRRPEVRSSR